MAAQNIAVEHQNQNLTQEHVLWALLEQENGLIPQLMQQTGADPEALLSAVQRKVEALPHVVTSNVRDLDSIYITRELESSLVAAERTAKNMKDE